MSMMNVLSLTLIVLILGAVLALVFGVRAHAAPQAAVIQAPLVHTIAL